MPMDVVEMLCVCRQVNGTPIAALRENVGLADKLRVGAVALGEIPAGEWGRVRLLDRHRLSRGC
jgi:hypothetical protein